MDVSFREPRATPPSFAQLLESVSINLQLNSVPMAFISGHQNVDAKTTAIALDATQVTSTLSRLQGFKFSAGSQALAFTVRDGDQGTLNWDGLYNGPAYNYGIGQAQFGTNSIAAVSKLQQLRTDIYVSSEPLKTANSEPITGPVPVRLKKVLEKLVKNFLDELNRSTTVGIDREILLTQHQQNQEPLQIWYDILAQSEDNDYLLTKNSYLNLDDDVAEHIARVYLSSSGNFFNTLLQFGNDFRLTYIPPTSTGTTARYGKLKGTGKIINSSVKTKKINLEQFEADISGFNLPPVSAVWVVGVGNAGIKLGTGLGTQVYGIWPSTATAYDGGVQRVDPPPWVATPTPLNVQTASTKSVLGSSFKTVVTVNQKELTDISKKHFNIFTEWARLWFADLKWANETVTINMPLDVTWELGSFYDVSNDKGKLFRGLVESISHRLSTRDAATTVRFSHVQYS